MFFHQLFINIYNITDIDSLKRKTLTQVVLVSFFFYVIDCNVFLSIPKHNGYGFISESFALN